MYHKTNSSTRHQESAPPEDMHGFASLSSNSNTTAPQQQQHSHSYPTQLVTRRRPVESSTEEGFSGTHIYAIRFPSKDKVKAALAGIVDQEQAPSSAMSLNNTKTTNRKKSNVQLDTTTTDATTTANTKEDIFPSFTSLPLKQDGVSVDRIFSSSVMLEPPAMQAQDWVTVNEEHEIYVVDTGMTAEQCDHIVGVTEQVCRGQYAAYTYAKQTLGCREFPALAHLCQPAVHTITHAILDFSGDKNLALDDREPHMVKYDVTKRERQKLDMHTDKSEWTFLISLSNGCGVDYEGGGTYFECLDATVHIQRGHALVFPGKLRHCGQRITAGLRYLLVGFLVDKSGRLADEDVTTVGAVSPRLGPQ